MEVTQEQRDKTAGNGFFVTEYGCGEPMRNGQVWIDQMGALDTVVVFGAIDVPTLLLLINGRGCR